MAPTMGELQQEFFATQLGIAEPWPSLTDLEYLFFLGVKNGSIVLGGGGSVITSADDLPATVPVFIVWTGTEWPARSTATSSAARTVIWVGNPGGAAPVDMADNDLWTQG